MRTNSMWEWMLLFMSHLKTEGPQVHRLSIINSVVIVLFLMSVIARIFIKTMRARAGSHAMNLSDKEAQQTKLSDEIVHSQLDVSDAFKGPELMKLLCVMVGMGTQIMGMAIITVTFSAMGSMLASGEALRIGIICFYPFVGFLGGFFAVYLWKIITGTSEDWRSICWYVASGFPGIVFAIHSVLNLVLWHQNSTAAVPTFVNLENICFWLGFQVPPTLLGGYLGAHTEQMKCPTSVEMVPRSSGASKFLVWLLALGAGLSPFATISVELYFILSSIHLGRYYDFYGSLLIVLLLLIITCVLVSMIITYSSLRAEDSGWWWKAFWASGSASIYVFLYCVSYLVYDARGLSGGLPVIIYIGYSIVIAISVMLAAGSVGFLGSFLLVKLLSSSKEIDFFGNIFNKLMPAPGE